MKTLVWERRKGISWITLNRPEIRNAVNYDMMDELSTVLTEIENCDS